jgi:aryl-alcohol dehydrogenase-like predicted oxidoreductase
LNSPDLVARRMIACVQLGKAGITTSRLAFGTSRLHYVTQLERQRLLAASADLGIVHFDTAPAYGDGLGETELGHLLHRGRDRFVVATKYGIPANPIMERFPPLGPPLRILRGFARRFGLWRYRLPPLTAAGLRASVERSLGRLKTDWIDIVFLHEPCLERLSQPNDILEQFNKLKERGLIRAFGLAGAWHGVGALVTAAPELAQVVQTSEVDWPETCPPDVTYGAVSGAAQNYFGSRIGSEIASQRLRSALTRRPNGVVIVSTTRIGHLRDLARAATGI